PGRSATRDGRRGKSAGGGNDNNDNNRKRTKSSPKHKTVGDVTKATEEDPTEFQTAGGAGNRTPTDGGSTSRNKPHRTRKRRREDRSGSASARGRRRTTEPEKRGGGDATTLPSLRDGLRRRRLLPADRGRPIDRGIGEAEADGRSRGRAAPEVPPVLENGIACRVDLGDSSSAGIFPDRRLRRAWLARRCCEGARVPNCFAHAGAFGVAAAAAGASTVSLDLDRKWLDRICPQMEANGMTEWEGRGTIAFAAIASFDWLARLAKRGERFDVVILDPPSTGVGEKKKRWSAKNDMAELVALAAPLVKSGGLLFATTNSASLRPEKFAKMCK
ncbi:hypothetical protein ACHAWF_000685, partial [Thalassiosira exigua]